MVDPAFAEMSFVYKMILMIIASNSKIYFLYARFVYHEAGLIASGIGFKAKDEKTPEEYNSIRCMDIYKHMWAPNAKEYIAHWNMRT